MQRQPHDTVGRIGRHRAGARSDPEPTISATAVLLALLGRERRDPTLIAVGILGVVLLPQALQRIDLHHVVWPATVVTAVALGAVAGMSSATSRPPIAMVPAVSSALVAVAVGLPYLGMASVTVTNDGRSIYAAPIQARTIGNLVAAVDAVDEAPGERLFVGAQDMSEPVLTSNGLYHLFPDKTRPLRYVEFLPGVTEQEGSGLARDVETADI